MFTDSFFLNGFNKFLKVVQGSRLACFIRDSLLFCHLDFLIWLFFLMTVLSTCFLSSGAIGGFALIFCFLNLTKLLFKKGETLNISKLDAIFIIYFLFIFMSLMGSSLFVLSLKGFFKTLTYFMFYFSSVYFFLNNKSKILPTVMFIALIMSYESIIAVIQHFNKVEALAGWVDTSGMSSENQLISRSFGTLNPSNPNLLGGYLIVGLSSLFAGFGVNFIRNNKRRSLLFLGLFALNVLAVIFTGCRGAYLGLIGFFLAVCWFVNLYVKRVYGGFSNIKKRYQNLLAGVLTGSVLLIALSPSILRRFVSIFHFRGDSSISFRMNVYEAAARMFQDNPILGVGLGNLNFREIYGLYMKTGFDALGSYCVPLEIAVESGIFALLSFILFIGYALYKGFKMFLDKNTVGAMKIVIFAIILTIMGTMAHGLFDTVWYRPQLQIIFWINIAILNSFILENNCNYSKNLL